MAKDKIILAELDIDTKNLVKAAQDTKKEMEQLIERQQKLSDKGKETSAEFVRNEAALKSLKQAYKEQTNAIAAQVNEDGRLLSTKKAVKDAVDQVNQSENDYLDNNKRLIALKKQLNSADDDYEKRLAKINEKLEENNLWLHENGSKNTQLVTTFGYYKNQVGEAFNSINIFNGGLGDFLSRAQQAGGTGKLFKTAIEGMTGGIKGMGTAIKANPIGFLLSLIAPLIEQFKKFAPLTNAVEKAMAGLAPILELASKPIEWLAKGVTGLVGIFSGLLGSMSSAADEAMKLRDAEALLNTEMALQEERNDKAKKKIDELIAKSKDQALSEGERVKALQDAAKVELDNYNERKRLSEEAYRIAQAKLQQDKDLSDEEMQILQNGTAAQIAKLQESEDITDEELKTLQAAKMEKQRIANEEGDILERQAADEIALQNKIKAEEADRAREADRKRKEQQDKAIERHKQLLDLFVAESEGRGKSLKEQLDYEDEYARRSLKLLKEQLQLKKITQLEYQIEELRITRDKENNKKAIAEQAANDELQEEKARLDLKLQRSKSYFAEETKINEALIENENARLKENLENRKKQLKYELKVDADLLAAKKGDLSIMSIEELQYLKGIEAMQAEHDAKVAENNKRFKDQEKAEKEKERVDAAAKRALDHEVALAADMTEWDEKKMLENQRYEDEKAELEERQRVDKENKLNNETEYKTLLEELEKNHTDNIKTIEEDLAGFQLEQKSKLFGDMATILGKESKAGKAFALAQATVDTYLAAQKAYLSQMTLDPSAPVRAAIAAGAAVAVGLKNIQKIVGVKDPKFEKGGLVQVGGNRHSSGGTLFTGEDGTRFEAEQGELIGVMNRNAALHFMAFNNAFPAGGSSAPNYFANGGIVSREIAQQQLNVDELASKIALANAALPQPVVAVHDIITQGNSYVQVREGANF